MGRPRKIPESLHGPILTKRAEDGLGSRAIAAWLKSAHHIAISHVAVSKLVTELLAERSQITQAVVAEKVGKHVTADLDSLENELARLDRIISAMASGLATEDGAPGLETLARIGQTPRAKVYADLVARKESLLTLKLKLSGAMKEVSGPSGVVVFPPLEEE